MQEFVLDPHGSGAEATISFKLVTRTRNVGVILESRAAFRASFVPGTRHLPCGIMMRYDAACIIIYPCSSPRVLFEIGVKISFIFAASVGFTHGLAGDEGKVKKKRDSCICTCSVRAMEIEIRYGGQSASSLQATLQKKYAFRNIRHT